MKRSWIPYIREHHLNKEAALPLLALPLIAAGKGLLAAGAAKAAIAGGAIAAKAAAGAAAAKVVGAAVAAKAAGGLAAAKAAGATIAASKTGAALMTAGKVANHAMTGMMIYDTAKAVTGGGNQQGNQTTDVQATGNPQVNTAEGAQQGANTEAAASNTSAPPSNTSTVPDNASNI